MYKITFFAILIAGFYNSSNNLHAQALGLQFTYQNSFSKDLDFGMIKINGQAQFQTFKNQSVTAGLELYADLGIYKQTLIDNNLKKVVDSARFNLNYNIYGFEFYLSNNIKRAINDIKNYTGETKSSSSDEPFHYFGLEYCLYNSASLSLRQDFQFDGKEIKPVERSVILTGIINNNTEVMVAMHFDPKDLLKLTGLDTSFTGSFPKTLGESIRFSMGIRCQFLEGKLKSKKGFINISYSLTSLRASRNFRYLKFPSSAKQEIYYGRSGDADSERSSPASSAANSPRSSISSYVGGGRFGSPARSAVGLQHSREGGLFTSPGSSVSSYVGGSRFGSPARSTAGEQQPGAGGLFASPGSVSSSRTGASMQVPNGLTFTQDQTDGSPVISIPTQRQAYESPTIAVSSSYRQEESPAVAATPDQRQSTESSTDAVSSIQGTVLEASAVATPIQGESTKDSTGSVFSTEQTDSHSFAPSSSDSELRRRLINKQDDADTKCCTIS